MQSVEKLDDHVESMGWLSRAISKREIKYLPKIIRESEKVYSFSSGFFRKMHWVIVVTNERILFLKRGLLFGVRQIELPIAQLSGSGHRTGLFFGEVSVSTSGDSEWIGWIAKNEVLKMASAISKLMNK